jgi:hypothetical protein
VLAESTMLRATQTLNRRSPRMVKRRNSPYAPHDRTARIRVPMNCTPHALAPAEPRVKVVNRAAKPWSPNNPSGGFFI